MSSDDDYKSKIVDDGNLVVDYECEKENYRQNLQNTKDNKATVKQSMQNKLRNN